MCSNIKLELLAKFNRQHVFTTFDARIYVECKNKEGFKILEIYFTLRASTGTSIEHFYFYILHFLYVRRMWYICKDVMSYFAVEEQVRGTGIKMKDEYKAEIWR